MAKVNITIDSEWFNGYDDTAGIAATLTERQWAILLCFLYIESLPYIWRNVGTPQYESVKNDISTILQTVIGEAWG